MVAFNIFFWILGAIYLLSIVYLYFLAAFSLIPAKKIRYPKKPNSKFAIIIPAHNEAKIINNTLKSIKLLDYPKQLYVTIVIADNCSDETERVARETGIVCLERTDEDRKGKGFALEWAFDKFKAEEMFVGLDAFVVIDADTTLNADFLKAMDRRITGGEMAIQGYYDVVNPELSPMASLSYLGFVISRNLRFKGRTRLGWSNNLLGNGMCFSNEVIARFGWKATSIVEDLEYAVLLQLKGIKVSFAPEARIFAEIPKTFRESKIQRSRWDIGKFQLRNKYFGQLVHMALKTRDLSYLDTAMELVIPPFSLFVIIAFASFGLFMSILYNGISLLFSIWLIIILAQIAYTLLGLAIAKASWKTYKNLIYAPFFILWRVNTVIWGYLFKIGKQWLKTERS